MTLVRLRSEFEVAKANQNYENLAIVVSKALGGGTKTNNNNHVPEGAKLIEDMDDLVAAFQSFGGMIGG